MCLPCLSHYAWASISVFLFRYLCLSLSLGQNTLCYSNFTAYYYGVPHGSLRKAVTWKWKWCMMHHCHSCNVFFLTCSSIGVWYVPPSNQLLREKTCITKWLTRVWSVDQNGKFVADAQLCMHMITSPPNSSISYQRVLPMLGLHFTLVCIHNKYIFMYLLNFFWEWWFVFLFGTLVVGKGSALILLTKEVFQ